MKTNQPKTPAAAPSKSPRFAAETPSRSQYASFERIFSHFNRSLFGGELPGCLLTFSRHAGALGFFAPERWADTGSTTECDARHEIALNPDHLGRTPEAVAGTLVHEMVHLWQQAFGTPSRSGYHNGEWADKMEAVGLCPSDTAAPGGKRTGQRVSHYIVGGAPFDVACKKLGADVFLPFVSSAPTKKTKAKAKVKYTCGGCGCNAWGKPDLSLTCNGCDEEMEAEG